ncbi:hypothetical protein IL306_008611 [Fusarium sp. DS 682]|nr:hypothetical protein IL306_008611 [Fusarium sp. DS 682]
MNNGQKISLLSLPSEILLHIIGDESLQWEDHCNLRRVSSRLFQLAGKYVYQGGDYCVFRLACYRADLKMLAACAQHDALPTDVTWTELSQGYLKLFEQKQPTQSVTSWYLTGGVYDSPDIFSSRRGAYGPGDVLSEGYHQGNFSADRFIEAWQWLSDQRCQLQTFQETEENAVPYHCFSPLLLTMLSTATDKAHHQGICDVIHFLFKNGFRIPHPDKRVRKKGSWPLYMHVELMNQPNMLEMLLQRNCPPSILQLFLQQVNEKGLNFTWDGPKTSLMYQVLEVPLVFGLLSILFDDIFAPYIYKGENPCHMGDNLEAKIGLLTKCQGINAFEIYMLRDILAALREIEVRNVNQSGLDFDRDGVWCWYQLCMAVSYIADEDVRKRTTDLHFTSPEDSLMIQPYLEPFWYAPAGLADARRRELDIRIETSGQGIDEPQGEDLTIAKWTEMPPQNWDAIPESTIDYLNGQRELIVSRYLSQLAVST